MGGFIKTFTINFCLGFILLLTASCSFHNEDYPLSLNVECAVANYKIPNEYLASKDKIHDEDVYWRLHGDDDFKRHWRNYTFENNRENGPYYQDILKRHFSGSSEEVQYNKKSGGKYPYKLDKFYSGYKKAFHAKMGLWHHSRDYNDTYRAHYYATGKNVIVAICDPKLHWQHHPDLIDRWYPNPKIPHKFHSDNACNSLFQYTYHGTFCDGAFFASANQIKQDSIDCTSSIGVAPDVLVYAQSGNLHRFVRQLKKLPKEELPKVISTSYVLSGSIKNLLKDLEELDINLVVARSYGKLGSHSMNKICDSDLAIGVGDYDPDYRSRTYYTYTDSLGKQIDHKRNASADLSRVNISAPGWNIWTTGHVPGGVTSKDTEYSLNLGNNTSIAAPQVAGAIALIAEKYPWMTASQRKQQLLNGAHHLNDIISSSKKILPSRPNSFYGAGCLSTYNSLFLHGKHKQDFINENSLLLGYDCVIEKSKIEMNSGEIRVLKGAKATLRNCSLVLSSDVKIYLEENSTLVINKTSTDTNHSLIYFREAGNKTIQGISVDTSDIRF